MYVTPWNGYCSASMCPQPTLSCSFTFRLIVVQVTFRRGPFRRINSDTIVSSYHRLTWFVVLRDMFKKIIMQPMFLQSFRSAPLHSTSQSSPLNISLIELRLTWAFPCFWQCGVCTRFIALTSYWEGSIAIRSDSRDYARIYWGFLC